MKIWKNFVRFTELRKESIDRDLRLICGLTSDYYYRDDKKFLTYI